MVPTSFSGQCERRHGERFVMILGVPSTAIILSTRQRSSRDRDFERCGYDLQMRGLNALKLWILIADHLTA